MCPPQKFYDSTLTYTLSFFLKMYYNIVPPLKQNKCCIRRRHQLLTISASVFLHCSNHCRHCCVNEVLAVPMYFGFDRRPVIKEYILKYIQPNVNKKDIVCISFRVPTRFSSQSRKKEDFMFFT